MTDGVYQRLMTMTRLMLLAATSAACLAGGAANAENLLNGPETVVWDSSHNRYLVSNMHAPCNIVAVSLEGDYTIFKSGLSWPHGMIIFDNTLYITVNEGSQGGVVGLDLTTGERVFEEFTASWYNGLIGLSADTSGWLYLSHGPSSVHRMRISDGSWFTVASGIAMPNGSHFDARNNRVIVPAESFQSYLHAIDAATYAVSTIPVEYGRYSCITEDHRGSFYVSAFWEGEIHRFDETFTSRELIATVSSPEGICFNKQHSTLVIPHLWVDALTFLPLDIDLWMETSENSGQVPFDAEFAGDAITEIDEWFWNFGDGGTSADASPVHAYAEPGLYDVSVRAITTTGDTLTRTYPRFMHALADTVWAETNPGPYGSIEVQVFSRNSVPLAQILLPVKYEGDLNLVYDSYSTAGCRTEDFEEQLLVDLDEMAKTMVFQFTRRAGYSPLHLPAGFGPIVKLYFYPFGATEGRSTIVRFDGDSGGYLPTFTARALTYQPTTVSTVVALPCCSGRVGDANGQGDDEPTISDISTLIDAKFITGTCGGDPPKIACLTEADTNQSGGADPTCDDITISDISILIDYLFITGSSLGLADCL